MKQIVIIKTFVAQLVCIEFVLASVLSANLSVTDPSQIGRDNSGYVCVLTQFKATIVVKPFDSSFLGTTYSDITPETSFNRATNCGNQQIEHYYRYNDTFDKTSVNQNSFSFGFEVKDDTIEVGLNYIEVLCDRPEGCLRRDAFYCSNKFSFKELGARKCLRMYANYILDAHKPGHSYQCSHNKKQKIKDLVYIEEIPYNRGTVEIHLQYLRIDATNSTKTFNSLHYCLADWYLDPILLSIAASIVGLIVFLCFCKCIIDCRRDRNRNRSGKYSMKRLEESSEESPNGHKRRHDSQKEELGPTVQL